MTSNDRRQFQRLKLAKPLMALLDGHNALVLDIGVSGAFIEHYGKLQPGVRVRLTFRWQGSDVEFLSSSIRTSVVREKSNARTVISQTALQFDEPVGDATERLKVGYAAVQDRRGAPHAQQRVRDLPAERHDVVAKLDGFTRAAVRRIHGRGLRGRRRTGGALPRVRARRSAGPAHDPDHRRVERDGREREVRNADWSTGHFMWRLGGTPNRCLR